MTILTAPASASMICFERVFWRRLASIANLALSNMITPSWSLCSWYSTIISTKPMKSSIWTYCTGIVKACHWWVVVGLLTIFFGLGITAMSHESAIVDEVAHISAGYSYLRYTD